MIEIAPKDNNKNETIGPMSQCHSLRNRLQH